MSRGEGGGRPRRWETGEQLDADISAYFAECARRKEPVGIYGFCDFVSIDASTLYDYESEKYDSEEIKFSHIIKRVRRKVKATAEKRIYANTAGAIAVLVNTTRKDPDPFRNAMHQELTGKDGKDLAIRLLKADETL
jgi:hypothetical protein